MFSDWVLHSQATQQTCTSAFHDDGNGSVACNLECAAKSMAVGNNGDQRIGKHWDDPSGKEVTLDNKWLHSSGKGCRESNLLLATRPIVGIRYDRNSRIDAAATRLYGWQAGWHLWLPGGKYLHQCTNLATHVGDFPCIEYPTPVLCVYLPPAPENVTLI